MGEHEWRQLKAQLLQLKSNLVLVRQLAVLDLATYVTVQEEFPKPQRKRSNAMDEKQVVAFLRCPASVVVELALEMANLTDRERKAIELCGRRGLTRDEAVEEIQKSKTPREIDAVKRWYRSGIAKLCIAREGIYWIEAILNYKKDAQ